MKRIENYVAGAVVVLILGVGWLVGSKKAIAEAVYSPPD